MMHHRFYLSCSMVVLLGCQSSKQRRPSLIETVTKQADLQHNHWWQGKTELNQEQYPLRDGLPLKPGYAHREQQIVQESLNHLLPETAGNARRRNAKGFCAEGTLAFRQNLPSAYKTGLIQPGSTFKVTGRFSNHSPEIQHDAVPDTRALSLRVQGVKGTPLLDRATGQQNQRNLVESGFHDLVAENRRVLPFHNIQEQLSYLRAQKKSGKALADWLVRHPKSALIMSHHAGKGSRSLAGEVFWSSGPIRIGRRAAKYHWRPRLQAPQLLATSGRDFLRRDLQQRLRSKPLVYDLLVQVQKDPNRQPIEDATAAWESTETPFMRFATLTFPPQTLDGSNSCSQLVFNSWNGIRDHRPLGSFMRLEKAILQRQLRKTGPTLSKLSSLTLQFSPSVMILTDNLSNR